MAVLQTDRNLDKRVKELEKEIAELHRSQNAYNQLFDSNPNPMWIYDLETLSFLAVNHAAVYQYGYSQHEFLSMTIKDIRPEEDVDALIENISAVTEGLDSAGIWQHVRKDGSSIYVEITSHALSFKGRPAELVLSNNVTEYIKAEQALKQSHQTLLTILDGIDATIYVADMDTYEILFMNRYMKDAFGDGLVGKLCHEAFREENLPCDWCTNPKLVDQAGKPTGAITWEGQNPVTGRWYINSDRALYWVDNRLVRLQVGTDITDIKASEQTLRESEDKYRNLFNNAQVGLGRTRITDGKVLESNEKMAQIFGYDSAGEFIDEYIFSENYVNPKIREQMLIDAKKTGIINNLETQFYRKDKSKAWVRFDTQIFFDKGYMEDVVVDISEQKRAQEDTRRLETQLHQAQKMEAIGTLAGGIAHDFNNLLMGMQGRTSMLLMDKDTISPDYDHLKGIEENIKSAAELTKQLLGFARGGRYELKVANLNDIVSKSADMFGRTKKEIITHKRFENDLWPAEVDQGQIEQVLLNLYVNAWQAMSGTGELNLETENITLKESFVKPHSVNPGRYVLASVTDTGIGMDEETQQRAFDPFFTTKEISRGTGLGLASAYGIIKSHGGIITVQSQKGHGATFTFYLPVSEKPVREEITLPKEVLKGSETILFIDDEEMIVEIGQELLETLGYTVLPARSGEQAIDIYKARKNGIDLIIMDMIMPGMGGNETYDQLKEINPDIRALLSSGYSIDGLAETILAKGCDGFIQKPFSLSELSQKVREILDK